MVNGLEKQMMVRGNGEVVLKNFDGGIEVYITISMEQKTY